VWDAPAAHEVHQNPRYLRDRAAGVHAGEGPKRLGHRRRPAPEGRKDNHSKADHHAGKGGQAQEPLPCRACVEQPEPEAGEGKAVLAEERHGIKPPPRHPSPRALPQGENDPRDRCHHPEHVGVELSRPLHEKERIQPDHGMKERPVPEPPERELHDQS